MSTKFQISAVICELNPLHCGHYSLFENMRRKSDNFSIAVMSGNYVQRGQPAIFDKWTRAETALAAGMDLVIELPAPWAAAGAEQFAFGGVSILDALGCVDNLCFGSECGDIDVIRSIAAALSTPAFSAALADVRKNDSGSSFAVLRQKAIAQLLGDETAAVLSHPNNTLGIAYCQALEKLRSSIVPATIPRLGASYHQEEILEQDQFPSATQLRKLLAASASSDLSPFMPAACAEILSTAMAQGLGPVFPEKLELAVLAKLRTLSMEDLEQLPDLSEGLERRLYQAIRSAVSLEELYDTVKTKRYSHARIRRLVLAAFLGIQKQDLSEAPPYAHVLGMSKRGAKLLSQIKETSRIPLITKYSDSKQLKSAHEKRIWDLENRGVDLYSLAYPVPQPCGKNASAKFLIR